MRLFHGTPYSIHTSERPFLDPSLAIGTDDGDPEEGHVFGTPDLLAASMYAFKYPNTRSTITTDTGVAVTYQGSPPPIDSRGYVYELPTEGFYETVRRGKPSGKWAMLGRDMPWVRDISGNMVRGLPLGEPARRPTLRSLIAEDGLRIFTLAGTVDEATYLAEARDAIFHGTGTVFIQEAVIVGWLRDVTPRLGGRNPSID